MIEIEGARRSSVRDELESVGFVPTASKLYQPSPGLVSRAGLLEQVEARPRDIVVVTAPAGYGKSSFLAELAANDPRPVAWVSLTPGENEPAEFLAYLALALDAIEPVAAECVTTLWGVSPTIGSPSLQRFGAMLGARRQPFVLVLDDVHELVRQEVVDILPVLLAEMPAGSSIMLGARTAIPLPLGRLRVRRRLMEVGATELAFDESEATMLLRQLGVDVDGHDVARLVERTEGWPVALYLAALAHGTRRGAIVNAIADFAGDHRYLVDYLSDELLSCVDSDVASFLMDASCFERVSGELCDDVLGRRGSAQLLEELRRQNLLVIPLDDHREWYRFHQLVAGFLQAELRRRDPTRPAAIHLRASEWCDAHGEGDGAVMHAVHAGDLDRAESLVSRWFGAVATAGRLYPTTQRWLAMFADHMKDRPRMMIVAAWDAFFRGDPLAALHWLDRAAAALPELCPEDSHGPTDPAALAVARALIAPVPPVEMARNAMYTYERVGLGEGHPASCLGRGAAAFMLGEEEEALRLLSEGAATRLERPLVVANCLAHVAVIHIEHGRWKEATIASRQARALLGEAAAFPSTALPVAVSVLVETHAAGGDDAAADRQRCRQHLTSMVNIAPWLNLQTRVALARAAVIRGNRVEAAALVEEASAILGVTPGAVRVADQLAGLRRQVAARDRAQTFGPSSLTTAELRVLQLLPTHLSVAEIADRLYVSRNTVKSQTIAIYRKLGTSSRGGAVEIATAAGLLH